MKNLTNLEDCKHVLPIKVDDTPGRTEGTFEELNEYLQTLSPRARDFGYTEYVTYKSTTSFDPASGMNELDITKAKNAATSGFLKAFLLDWDRTLTIAEGVLCEVGRGTITDLKNYIGKRNKFYTDTVDKALLGSTKPATEYSAVNLARDLTRGDMAEYYFGGNERMEKLRSLWEVAREHNIEIYILTANPNAGKKKQPLRRKVFLEILAETGLDLPDDHMFCLHDYYGDKQLIIKNILKMCGP